MFKKINRDDNIFNSEPFLKDIIAFNIMVSIIENPDKYPLTKVFSNGNDCAIVCSDSQHPVIVWTIDTFNDYQAVFDFVLQEFGNNKPFKIMSKIGLYDFLKRQDRVDASGVTILGAYQLKQLNDIKYIGRPDNVIENEVPIVAELMALFGNETGEDKNASTENCMEKAKEWGANPLNKVWRDNNGKIVAITRLNESEKYARVGYVITAPDERGKSYAKMLVHFMSRYALDIGKTPMLFTDYEYAPSNKCYTAIGYELVCTIANYGIKS